MQVTPIRSWGMVGVSLILLFVQTGGVLGQITSIREADFSDEAVELPVLRTVRGSPAAETFTTYGVRFSGDASAPITESVTISLVVPPEFDAVIRNVPLEGTSAGKALIMEFRLPLRRIGFTLSNGTFATLATIRALTRKGELLGNLEIDEVRELRGPFVGFETSHPDGISTVTLDYGQEANPEQITRIRFDYLQPPSHSLWAPQVIAAQAGVQRLSTVLRLQTLPPTRFGTVSAVLRFFDTSGRTMPVQINGEVNDTFEMTVPFLGFRRIPIEAPGPGILQGYAEIEANEPIVAGSIFQLSSSSISDLGVSATSAVLSQVGIDVDPARTSFVFPVLRDRGEGLNSGIAVVNTSDEETFVDVRIFEATGLPPDPIRNQPGFFLAPGEHRAFFLSQLCSQSPPQSSVCTRDFLADGDFEGTIEVASRHPVAVTALITKNGLPFSSLPIGSTQR